ncbi:MAG: MotA/TolQ/ExbB proton channel family protein [Opitutales bacterium]|jgi:biopolymer transport protein ExbB|nr:MotA/TolQ/ExbB proton channel family protein [Opitutales bacterium]MDG2253537.1 MotA/TolQ/ExbB proton channel family protein [Opitutaceae bacterium]MBT5168388.1 MotA/TolQ/ExbB proton channel family protein [Opitutales bacterium]MBT5816666.1 MotA/TolQ/ExbB proton channel family protein [Opitutales bacterium]MBT6380624.1 MotA/TolQ/ExbB proton channel family protein [Opitutales bacterium]
MKDKPYLDQAIEIIASGGWIMIPLFILGFLAFYVAARLFLYFLKGHFGKTSLEVCEEWVKDSSKAKGQVGEIIRYSQDGVEDLSDIQNRFAEIRTAEMPRLNQNITMLTILVNTAPLMGLLGTVLGMLQTFYGISLGGSEKTTNIVASGIHEALITTQMGLCLAIPGYFVIYFLRQKVIDYESFLVRLESITLQQFRK